MIDTNDDVWGLAAYKMWFLSYVEEYLPHDDQTLPMIRLKQEHSVRVSENCRTLAEELTWSRNDIAAAELLGLLHDIGRFAQFSKYRTFLDSASINHGEFGYDFLVGSGTADHLPVAYRGRILTGVRHHNARQIPSDISESEIPFVKLIRDADKLDIYRIIAEDMAGDRVEERIEKALKVPANNPPCEEAMADILAETTVANEHVKSLADFHLMQLSWVYDINFRQTMRRIVETGVLEAVASRLSHSEKVERIYSTVLDHARAAVT